MGQRQQASLALPEAFGVYNIGNFAVFFLLRGGHEEIGRPHLWGNKQTSSLVVTSVVHVTSTDVPHGGGEMQLA